MLRAEESTPSGKTFGWRLVDVPGKGGTGSVGIIRKRAAGTTPGHPGRFCFGMISERIIFIVLRHILQVPVAGRH
jgi:hypothetical protein